MAGGFVDIPQTPPPKIMPVPAAKSVQPISKPAPQYIPPPAPQPMPPPVAQPVQVAPPAKETPAVSNYLEDLLGKGFSL